MVGIMRPFLAFFYCKTLSFAGVLQQMLFCFDEILINIWSCSGTQTFPARIYIGGGEAFKQIPIDYLLETSKVKSEFDN